MTLSVRIRDLTSEDNIVAITNVIRLAYAQRAADNLRFWATYQTVEDTANRFRSGHGLVAEFGDRVVGTITVNPPDPASEVPIYREPATWHFCQFAVLPELQGEGIGRRLHDSAANYAYAHGGRTMSLDTAAPASELIEMYSRWGYVKVGEWDWRPHTNYLSVVMARSLFRE
jgi:GNAT superfamily N-acetyltransferase